MKKRTSSLPVLVVVAVVALVLGSFGTATAAGLTKGQVKKIAAKVVKKQAPSLSVAHATSADTATTAANATQLGGKAASAYQTQSYLFRLPVQAAASERVYSFPGLPNGTYQFTYSVLAVGGTASMFCYMRPTAANVNGEGFQYPVVGGAATITASGVVTNSGAVNLRCLNTANFTIYGGGDVLSSVTFTRVDSLVTSSGTAPRGTTGSDSGSGLTN
jgi:hypothetical protein